MTWHATTVRIAVKGGMIDVPGFVCDETPGLVIAVRDGRYAVTHERSGYAVTGSCSTLGEARALAAHLCGLRTVNWTRSKDTILRRGGVIERRIRQFYAEAAA